MDERRVGKFGLLDDGVFVVGIFVVGVFVVGMFVVHPEEQLQNP